MAAYAPRMEEVAVAMPAAFLKIDGVWIVVTVERYRKLLKVDAVTFLSIALRLLDLANHPMVHFSEPPKRKVGRVFVARIFLNKKHAGIIALRVS